MVYEVILKGSELFHQNYVAMRGDYYDEYLDSDSFTLLRDPRNLDTRSVERLIVFLNQWKTHYQSSPSDLLKAIKTVSPLALALSDSSLLTQDFSQPVATFPTAKAAIEDMFQVIVTCGPRHESTGTSKILHMINPSLFVMWDDRIRSGYAVERTNKDYANVFLPRMQSLARRALTQVSEAFGLSQESALQRLTCCGHTMAMVIDEYNYCKFTKRLGPLWEIE